MEDISSKKLHLEWDNYIGYLIEAIGESNFMKRAEDKGMQTSKNSLEAHITSRARHVTAAADISKRIAEGLGLNANYIYAGMLMHDAGHPFTAHDGEELFTGIGEVDNVEYYHHNAKGIETIISENICEKAVSKIPNIKNRPELRKKLEDEFYYFLDVVVSHDGEASANEMNSEPEEYPDIRTAVFEKLRLSNATNNYKFIAQTTEGRIAKYADVIAYLSTDIQDRFRLGIQKDFDQDYLEFLGDILSDDYIAKREEKIEIAKNIIEEIKEEKLMQLVSDARAIENREIIEEADKLIKKIREKVENYENLTDAQQKEQAGKVIERYIKNYRKEHQTENMSDEDKKYLEADITKLKEFTRKKLRMRSAVIEEITSRVREKMIQNLLKESKAKGDITFSDNMKRLFFTAKKLNYKYVPETKWNYLAEELPVATDKLVHMVALALRKTGAIESKFYDKTMRKHVTEPEAIKYLKTLGYTDEEGHSKYRKKYGIRFIKGGSKFTSEGKREINIARQELCNAAYHYVLDSGELFAIQYQNTFHAIENQITLKIKEALNLLPQNEKKKRKTDIEYFDKKVARQEEYIRKKFIKKYGSAENVTEEQIKEFAKPIIKRERKKIEGKMAIQMAINYISGMGDSAMRTHAEECGFIEPSKFENGFRKNDGRKNLNDKYDITVPGGDTVHGGDEEER